MTILTNVTNNCVSLSCSAYLPSFDIASMREKMYLVCPNNALTIVFIFKCEVNSHLTKKVSPEVITKKEV